MPVIRHALAANVEIGIRNENMNGRCLPMGGTNRQNGAKLPRWKSMMKFVIFSRMNNWRIIAYYHKFGGV